MRIDVSEMTRADIVARFGVSRVTAWRAMNRGWICGRKEHTAPMTEDDGRFVLAATSFVRDDDLRSNAILRCVELWGDIIIVRNRSQYVARIAMTEIKRRRNIGPT